MKGKHILLLYIIWIVLTLVSCSSQEAPPLQAGDILEENQPVQAFGVVKALITRDISVDFPVKIEKLQVKEGQVVSGGEMLAIIDTGEAERAIHSLENRIGALKSETDVKQNVYAQKKESVLKDRDPEILKLENALEKTQKIYDTLISEKTAKVSLYNEGVLTGNDLMEFKNSIEAAGNACKDAELNINSLQESLHAELLQTEAQINEALREISGLEAELQDSRQKLLSANLKGNNVISDITRGIVCSVDCKPGSIIPAGAKLFTVIDASSFVIEANVDEQFIKDVELGAKAYIIPEFDRSLEYSGKVWAISAYAVQQNGETVIPVEIIPEKPGDWINPGYNMEVSIEVK
jgi:multidrug resistance efflux pump